MLAIQTDKIMEDFERQLNLGEGSWRVVLILLQCLIKAERFWTIINVSKRKHFDEIDIMRDDSDLHEHPIQRRKGLHISEAN